MEGENEPLLQGSLVFEPKSQEERERINAFREGYQAYRRGEAKGARGEFTARALRLRLQEEKTRTFNKVVSTKVICFNCGANLYLIGSVYFLDSIIAANPGTGAWLFIIGSVFYTIGSFLDLSREIFVLRGFRAFRRRSQASSARNILYRLSELGAIATPKQVHINVGLLRTNGTHVAFAEKADSAIKRRERKLDRVQKEGAALEESESKLQLLIAVVYFISCSVRVASLFRVLQLWG